MKQILQDLKSGQTLLADVPAPGCEPGHLLIRTRATLVSQGTEKMLVEFGKASLLQKARSQPDKVRQVLQKIRSDGLIPTMEAVFRRLDEPLPLGYCNAGEVIAVGEGVAGFSAGDRVASNGPHAEIVSVPANLCARIPDGVGDDEAAFTVAGSIALQGIRLVAPTLGETVVVVGLGLLGQLAVQLLRANGCRVIGFDYEESKVALARAAGVEAHGVGGESDPVRIVAGATAGLGADAVLITASTRSNEVIRQAARMSRKRGRVVLVGVVGLELNRADFYEKELTFQVSCSYGPGRYDHAYEEKGFDYPAAFVRWTEHRNFEAVLAAMAARTLDVRPLVTKECPVEQCGEVYANLGAAGLATILRFRADSSTATSLALPAAPAAGSAGQLAIVGAGNFTKMTVLPALAKARVPVGCIVSAGGVSGTHLARRNGIARSTTDFDSVVADPAIAGLIIATRHDLHARQAAAALRAGKHVLVEKPLCLSAAELRLVEQALAEGKATLSVGFNRRFSPHAVKLRELLGSPARPLTLVATMNAGAIPAGHWVHDPETGGGRLVGEACHFVDFAIFATGSLIDAVCAAPLAGGASPAGDTASILLRHRNGSVSTVNYFANGHRSSPKERVEVFSEERVLVLDDFRELRGFGFKRFDRLKTGPDKGHAAQFGEFARRVREGGGPLIPWAEVRSGALATLAIGESIRRGAWVAVEELA